MVLYLTESKSRWVSVSMRLCPSSGLCPLNLQWSHWSAPGTDCHLEAQRETAEIRLRSNNWQWSRKAAVATSNHNRNYLWSRAICRKMTVFSMTEAAICPRDGYTRTLGLTGTVGTGTVVTGTVVAVQASCLQTASNNSSNYSFSSTIIILDNIILDKPGLSQSIVLMNTWDTLRR